METKKRNAKRSFMIYGLGAMYLYYTAYQMISGVLKGDEEAGDNGTIYILFGVFFVLAATWLVYQSYKSYKKAKAIEAEEAEEARRALETGEELPPKEEAPQGILGGLFGAAAQQQTPSIAARAMAYQNPADEEEEQETDAE